MSFEFDKLTDEQYERLLATVEAVDENLNDLMEAAGYVLENMPGYLSIEQALPLQEKIVADIKKRRAGR